MRLRYGMVPHNLCSHCDRCVQAFNVEHALNCKKGGLVGIRHDDVRDEAGAVAAEALSKGRVSYEPFINYSKDSSASAPLAAPAHGTADEKAEARGDVLVHGLWKTGTACVLDVAIVNTDSKLYEGRTSEKCMALAGKGKKVMYEAACLGSPPHIHAPNLLSGRNGGDGGAGL